MDNWNDEEIRVLLNLWADDRIQESLESFGRNIVVYRRMADRFSMMIYCRSIWEIRGAFRS